MANTSRFPTNPTGRTEGTSGSSNIGQATHELKEKAQDTTSQLGQKAQDIAGNVRDKAQQFASSAASQTEDTLSNVGEKMSSLAGTLRERAPHEGMLGTAAGAVADRLETSGRYLQSHGLSDMTDDLSGLIRQNPIPSLLVGFGVGFMLGMAWRR
jgi:ElaB/YqjD/DUF883 family membrane-anchored ribosome-binding protein